MSIHKKILVLLLLLMIFAIDIGYAKVSDEYLVKETVNSNKDFCVQFENASVVRSFGVRYDEDTLLINKNEIELNQIDLLYPGSEIEFSANVVNEGIYPVEVNSVSINGNNNCRAIKILVDDIEKCKLNQGDKVNLHFKVFWDEDVNKNVNETVDFKILVNFSQVI